MDKTYDHSKEAEVYRLWEESGAFIPKKEKGKKPFTIIMPPPNANDPLHIGHARFVTIEDILIRYFRLKGVPALWLPGSDHAGIETQFVFEKKLKAKGKSRFDYDQKTLYKMIWDYVQENTGTMEKQLKILGASCDWSRFKFTLDPEIVKVVLSTFKKLYDDGLIYRDRALVNYCTHCGTAFSNLEINHVEKVSPLYFVKYPLKGEKGHVVVATVRPEPIYVDTHLAVNPKDKKRKDLIGKIALNPLTGKEMEIISDEFVDPEFGTGVVKLTPAHDFNDYEVAKKLDLPIIEAIGWDGKMVGNEKYEGFYPKQAREKVVEDLQQMGLIEKIDENYKNTISVCYRCKNPIEPMPLEQWFLKVEPLAKEVLGAVKKGDTKFAAKKYEKIAIHWLKNLKDWNISRQIVWGIRIPAFRCEKCDEWTITAGETPKRCSSCGHDKLIQDTDTFDTWFSSGQWPFATLKTTKEGDFEYFYPTSVMETGYDILPFWVIRMLMLGLFETGKVPFENVVLHGLVRDKNGAKISKSKGNVIDPIEMTKKYGADALRMGLVWGAKVSNDIALSEENIKAQRNFANKIWNVARFVSMEKSTKGKENESDKKILKRVKETKERVARLIEGYRLNEAAEMIYDFVWNDFANDYLESVKDRRSDAQKTLEKVLEESLKMLHPFMPFVTESIWQQLKDRFDSPNLIEASW